MFVNVHDKDRGHETQEVSDERGIEVQAGFSLKAAVKAKEKSDEDSRNDDVAESQHGKVRSVETVGEQILWENEFDGRLEALRDCNHDICSKHPENIINKKSTKQDTSSDDVVQMQQLNAIDGERQSKQIVRDPVLLEQIPQANDRRKHQTNDVVRCEFIIDEIFVDTFREFYVEGNERNG